MLTVDVVFFWICYIWIPLKEDQTWRFLILASRMLTSPGAPVVSKATRAHPALAMALCRGCREACPDFHFTSIQAEMKRKKQILTLSD